MGEGLQLFRVGHFSVEPEAVLLRVEDDRLPVVQRMDQTVGRGSQDRATLQGLSIRVLPVIPDSCKAHDGAVLHPDVGRMLHPALFLPFEESVCGNDAAPVADCGPEGRFLVDRLAAGVDHKTSEGRILCPGRNEPPTHEGGPMAGFRSPDCQDLLGGRDVVAQRKIAEDCYAEDFGEKFGG